MRKDKTLPDLAQFEVSCVSITPHPYAWTVQHMDMMQGVPRWQYGYCYKVRVKVYATKEAATEATHQSDETLAGFRRMIPDYDMRFRVVQVEAVGDLGTRYYRTTLLQEAPVTPTHPNNRKKDAARVKARLTPAETARQRAGLRQTRKVRHNTREAKRKAAQKEKHRENERILQGG